MNETKAKLESFIGTGYVRRKFMEDSEQVSFKLLTWSTLAKNTGRNS